MTLGLSIGPRIKIGPTIKLSGFDPNAAAWFNVCSNAGSAVNNVDQAAVTAFVVGMKADGLWALTDRACLLAAASSTQALIDLKSLVALTAVSSPTFAAYGGYSGNPGYVDLNFTPSTAGGQWLATSAAAAVYTRTNRLSGANYGNMGTVANGQQLHIYPWYGDGNTYFVLNGPGDITIASAAVVQGFWLLTNISTVTQGYRNGSTFGPSQSSGGVSPTSSVIVGAAGSATDLSSDQNAFAWCGAGLTPTQVTNLYNRIQTLATNMTTAWNV